MSPKLKQFTEDKINNLGSRDGALVRSLASQQCDPGSILDLHHMWVEFVVGMVLVLACFSGYSGFPLSP